ncbi:hypothetical protein HJFPF1_06284 [Paramyrothecium foliicola]|nr:hypothetical protein HJFPF1_06284 [Paramyrothecium foliicola]
MLSVLKLLGRLGYAKNTPHDQEVSDTEAPSESEAGSDVHHAAPPSFALDNDAYETNEWLESPSQDYSDYLVEPSFVSGVDLREQMEEEKQMYPGASTWAGPEEELFEALFMRQDRPLLPSHWNLDFRGMPMSANIFDTSDDRPPVVYTHSENDFHGTDALTRLIDLTADARTAVQSGSRRKAPRILKRGLESFITWASRDGGYSNLKYVPNIVVSIVPRRMNHEGVDTFMQTRMRSLALLQREFLRVDRAPDFWETIASPFLGSRRALESTFGPKLAPYPTTPRKRSPEEAELSPVGLTANELASLSEGQLLERHVKRQRLAENYPVTEETKWFSDEWAGGDRPSIGSTSTSTSSCTGGRADRRGPSGLTSTSRPRTPVRITYRRKPPVVYGLFIVGTSVFLLTLDSSKGDEGYVSFHLELNFLDAHQSVWNGLTLAIAICLARDELMARKDDFAVLPAELESDPDI